MSSVIYVKIYQSAATIADPVFWLPRNVRLEPCLHEPAHSPWLYHNIWLMGMLDVSISLLTRYLCERHYYYYYQDYTLEQCDGGLTSTALSPISRIELA
jgi:hypothetical protein